jgi:hypothetical protein
VTAKRTARTKADKGATRAPSHVADLPAEWRGAVREIKARDDAERASREFQVPVIARIEALAATDDGKAWLADHPEVRRAQQLAHTFAHLADQLADPALHPAIREANAKTVAAAYFAGGNSARSGVSKLGALFNAVALASSWYREWLTPEGGRIVADAELATEFESSTAYAVRRFAESDPHDAALLEVNALREAIESWHDESPGKRKGRRGKYVALEATIAKTSFAQAWGEIKKALTEWRRARYRPRHR